MNVLSLFDGISCGRLALERAGFKVDNYYASEIDKYAIQISKKNWPDIVHLGDVFDIDYSALPEIDLVIGGSPCTHWSIAKQNRETTNEGEGFRLFMQFVRAIRELNPKYFLFENNHSIHKNIKNEISKALGVPFIMINSALVSAQQRKRCYWTNIPVWSMPADKGIVLRDILEKQVDPKYFLSEKSLRSFTSMIDRNGYVRGDKFRPLTDDRKAFALTTRNGQRATDTFIIQRSRGYNTGGIKAMDGKVPTLTCSYWQENNVLATRSMKVGFLNKGCQADRVYSVYGKSVTLSANGGGHGGKTGLYKFPECIRKLTPVECERLQTLPDNYTSGVSDTQRYRCLGNGWTVDVIAHIFSFLNSSVNRVQFQNQTRDTVNVPCDQLTIFDLAGEQE